MESPLTNTKLRHRLIYGSAGVILAGLLITGTILLRPRHDSAPALTPQVATASTQNLQPPLSQPSGPTPEQQASCQKFITDLQDFRTLAQAHLDDLRNATSNAYQATNANQINLDNLIAKANTVKQDLADYQQTYSQFTSLLNYFTQDQIDQIQQIRTQFADYAVLSERFDNTLTSIDDYYNSLLQRETKAPAKKTVTKTTTSTATVSQPGATYTSSVYYTSPYYYPYYPYYPYGGVAVSVGFWSGGYYRNGYYNNGYYRGGYYRGYNNNGHGGGYYNGGGNHGGGNRGGGGGSHGGHH